MMMPRVPAVHADASLAEVVEWLVTSVQRRVVVVDDERRVVGIEVRVFPTGRGSGSGEGGGLAPGSSFTVAVEGLTGCSWAVLAENHIATRKVAGAEGE